MYQKYHVCIMACIEDVLSMYCARIKHVLCTYNTYQYGAYVLVCIFVCIWYVFKTVLSLYCVCIQYVLYIPIRSVRIGMYYGMYRVCIHNCIESVFCMYSIRIIHTNTERTYWYVLWYVSGMYSKMYFVCIVYV